MRSNIILLLVMAAYFTVADIGYGIWSHLYFGAVSLLEQPPSDCW